MNNRTPQVVVLGSINVDHVVRVDRMPSPGETITGSETVEMLGDKGANLLLWRPGRWACRVNGSD